MTDEGWILNECTLRGVLYRMRPHSADATKLAVWYVIPYERDGSLDGHPGDVSRPPVSICAIAC